MREQYTMTIKEKLRNLMWLSKTFQRKNQVEHGGMSDPSKGQGRVLAALKMQPEMSTKDLAYLLDIRTQSLNELLGKLEKKECIARVQSTQDKRVMMVRITPKGTQEQQEDASSNWDEILNCLSNEEQENLSGYLDRIIEALEAQVGSASDVELEWKQKARERFGDNLDQLLAMRRGGFPQHKGCHGHKEHRGHGKKHHKQSEE